MNKKFFLCDKQTLTVKEVECERREKNYYYCKQTDEYYLVGKSIFDTHLEALDSLMIFTLTERDKYIQAFDRLVLELYPLKRP